MGNWEERAVDILVSKGVDHKVARKIVTDGENWPFKAAGPGTYIVLMLICMIGVLVLSLKVTDSNSGDLETLSDWFNVSGMLAFMFGSIALPGVLIGALIWKLPALHKTGLFWSGVRNDGPEVVRLNLFLLNKIGAKQLGRLDEAAVINLYAGQMMRIFGLATVISFLVGALLFTAGGLL